jgi:hypothetical protein
LRLELGAGGRRGDGRRDHDARGIVLAERGHGGPHARAGGEAVVDEDDGLAAHVERRAVVAIGGLATGELAPLVLRHRLDRVGRDAERAHELLVEDENAARAERAHGELLVAGHPQLADREDVERQTQATRDLIRDGHASAGQPEHHSVAPVRVRRQPPREEPPRLHSIAKQHRSLLRDWRL